MNFKKVKSSNISEIGHDPAKSELYIKFTNGSVYVYQDVSITAHDKLMKAKSHGVHLNTHIIPKSKWKVKQWK